MATIVARETYYIRNGLRVLVARGEFAKILSPKDDDDCRVIMRWAGWRHPLSVEVAISTVSGDLESLALVRVGVRRALDLRRRMREIPRAEVVRR